MNIFLTGQIQVGKSTLINKFLNKHKNLVVGGFKTLSNFKEDIGVYGGVYIVPASENEPFYTSETLVGNRLKKESYPENFDLKGVEFLKNNINPDIFVMDEIGFMETNARLFSKEIMGLLDGDIPVIGVVKPMIEGLPLLIKSHPKSIVLEVNVDNRDSLYLEFEKNIMNQMCL